MALALLSVWLSGCVSTKPKIEAKRDSTYSGKLERVLIVYHNDEAVAPRLGPKFSEEFLSRFSELLGQRGVVSEVIRPNKDAVDENVPVRAAADRFHPRQALHFGLVRMASRSTASGQTYYSMSRLSHQTSLAFAFSLFDGARGQTVWRGELHYLEEPDPKVVANEFVEQLESERLLGRP